MQVHLKPQERIDMLYSNTVKIIQNPNFFSFSLDAVLLANFAEIRYSSKTKIIDLCAGNGAIGLFLSQKTTGKITLLELQTELADMAQRSVELNNLTQQYRVINAPLANAFEYVETDSFDVVTCNPPYFKQHMNSKKNPNPHLALARHEIATNLEEVVQTSSRLLKMNGKFYLVHRPDRLDEILLTLLNNRLAPKRIQFVQPRQSEEANIVLIEAIKDGRAGGVRILPPIIVYDGTEYTEEIKEIVYDGKE